MIVYIKEKLLENIEYLKELLEHYGYCNISVHRNYISFGRNMESSPKSIVIKTENNKYLYVTDYARNLNCDIFKFIIIQRNVDFRDVINVAKNILGIDNFYEIENKSNKAFGGFYQNIKKKNEIKIKTYDEKILDNYIKCGNIRFLKDNISLETQKKFDIGYDIQNQAISIPIRNEFGEMIGVKARINKEPEENEQKYYYLIPCSMSQTLYGYSQNYEYLESTDVIYVFESEKSTMATFSYNYKCCVSLGSGTISKKQVQLLLSLNPKKIIFLHDVNYPLESIIRNINMVKGYSKMRQIELGYWDYFGKNYEDKISCTDKGKDFFEYVIHNEIRMVK